MDKDPVENNPGSNAEPKLTAKQAKFVAAYVDPAAANGNGTLASKLAGYRGNNNQLAVQASENLRKPKIQQVISASVDAMMQRTLKRVNEALDATKSQYFLDKAGNVVTTVAVPDHKIRLQAGHFVFELRTKCNRGCFGQIDSGSADDAAAQEEDLNAADRAELRQAAKEEAEPAEIDREPADHDGDHGAAHEGEQTSSTMPVTVEAAPAEIDRVPADGGGDHGFDE